MRSAKEDAAPLPDPSTESFSYTLWTTDSDTQHLFDPSPTHVVATRNELPDRGWILFLGQGVSGDSSLPRRLLACQNRYIDVRLSQADTHRKASVDRLVRDHSLTGQTLDSRRLLAHTDEQCVWFRAEDFPDLRATARTSLGQWRKNLGFGVSLRAGVDQDNQPVVTGHFSLEHAFQILTLRYQHIPLLASVLWIKIASLYLLPLAGLLFTPTRPYAALAILLMLLTRLGQDIRYSYPGFSFLTDWVLRPYLLATLARHDSGISSTQAHSKGRVPAVTRERTHFLMNGDGFALGKEASDRTQLEAHIMLGEASGAGPMGFLMDRWLLNRSVFRGLRWGSVVVARALGELKPAKLMAIGHLSILSSQHYQDGRVWFVDPDQTLVERYAVRAGKHVPWVSAIDALPEEIFDCVVFQHVAEFVGDAALRRQLKAISMRLAENGNLIITTTHPHGLVSMLETHLNWPTRVRSGVGVESHLVASEYQVRRRFVDPGETQSVLIAGKRNVRH
ncbi:MAG: class I SAM-dependent methyltransferase [Myxococcota bacterium]|nr:class I SAM-dependent methyltransferase [Myxococcota bacterium]